MQSIFNIHKLFPSEVCCANSIYFLKKHFRAAAQQPKCTCSSSLAVTTSVMFNYIVKHLMYMQWRKTEDEGAWEEKDRWAAREWEREIKHWDKQMWVIDLLGGIVFVTLCRIDQMEGYPYSQKQAVCQYPSVQIQNACNNPWHSKTVQQFVWKAT